MNQGVLIAAVIYVTVKQKTCKKIFSISSYKLLKWTFQNG